MKAILQPAYGLPDVLVHADVPTPPVRADGALVKVMCVSLHKGDWHLLTGTPYLVRLAGFGVLKPNRPIPGMAIAGIVVAVGADVRALKPGDEVFGEIGGGGFAEYVCVAAGELAPIPAGVSFEAAATLPVSATTALQGLRDAGLLASGQSVLVNGAAGGVGTFAVQIARALGGLVTGVCSARNAGLVQSLGADHVIDYGVEDFTQAGVKYDVIFDLVGNHSPVASRRALAPRGRLIACAGGAENRVTGPMFSMIAGMMSNIGSTQPFVPLVAKPCVADLVAVAALVAQGMVTPVIDRRYTLEEVPDALRYLGTGRSRGKSVVHVALPPGRPGTEAGPVGNT
jgi:NADPH:quinone reductase-like Zn-dependent oxidoreductase